MVRPSVFILKEIDELKMNNVKNDEYIRLNSEFRIKWPLGQLGSLPADAEQNLRLNYIDKDLIKKYCSKADVVHHLAGITDVPRTKGESSKLQDEKIKEVGERGTQNILDAMKKDAKIIFPSTHVIFEGLNFKIKIYLY